jgi:signal peptidase I
MNGAAQSGYTQGHHERPSLWARARTLLTLVVLALLVRSLVIAPFNIPSRSMTPTMLVGDYLFVAKWPYGYSRFSLPFSQLWPEGRIGSGRPARGDIVVFRSPADPDTTYVKRVIGLPGDRVRVLDGQLFLNGDPIPRTGISDFEEPVANAGDCPVMPAGNARLGSGAHGELVCYTPRYRETLPDGRSYYVLDAGDSTADTTEAFVVPEGHYFLMGDDRDRSADSRFPAEPGGGVGFVPEDHIVGRALVIFWSTDGSASWFNPISWFTAARWARIGRGY